MPRTKRNQLPSYRLHKQSGQAVVTLCGHDFYLGPHGTDVSRAEYDRRVAEYLVSGRRLPGVQADSEAVTINEVLLAYARYSKGYYVNREGEPDREWQHIERIMIPIRRMYGTTPAADFGPLALKAIRQQLISEGLSRRYCNNMVGRIKRMFKWAVGNQLVPPAVLQGLQAVTGLLAVTAYLAVGDNESAEQILEWVRCNASEEYLPCLVAYATTAMGLLSEGRGSTKPLAVYNVTPEERSVLAKVRTILAPEVDPVSARGQVTTGLHVEALSLSCTICHLLGDRRAAADYAKPLLHVDPLPLEYARAVVREDATFDPSVIERLRRDHSECYDALLLACVLQARYTPDRLDAFEKAESLMSLSKSTREKEQLVKLCYDLAQDGPANLRSRARACAERLLDRGHLLLMIWDVNHALSTDDLNEAERLLSSMQAEDEPMCLQLVAELRRRRNDLAGSIVALSQAVALLPAPDILYRLAQASLSAKDYESAVSSLERLLKECPDRPELLSYLSHAYYRVGRFSDASGCLKKLHRLEPNDTMHSLNLATCLSRSGDREGALSTLEELCTAEDAPVEAVIGRAQLLHAGGRPDSGFESLHQAKLRFWDEPTFLLQYLSLGYAAEKDTCAQEALVRIVELQKQGKVPEHCITNYRPSEERASLGGRQTHTSISSKCHSIHNRCLWDGPCSDWTSQSGTYQPHRSERCVPQTYKVALPFPCGSI